MNDLFITTLFATFTALSASNVIEYCSWELFNATCTDGSLVVMETASFGRMRLGRCLDTEFQIGCSADVLPFLDARCSGRPSCLLQLPDNSLHHQQPCAKDMLAYLEASYTCIKVSNYDSQPCTSISLIGTEQTEGYLASFSAQTFGHGVTNCPWNLIAKPGQRFKLTLLDFSIAARYRTDKTAQGPSKNSDNRDHVIAEYCHVYAYVTETQRGVKKTAICGELSREQIVYSSTSHQVSVELSDLVVTDKSINFLVRFHVIGCADQIPAKGTWLERAGDRLTIRCNNSVQSWHLICKGTNWVGHTSDCETSLPLGDKVADDTFFPTYGLVIAVVIGILVGSLCGFLLLTFVLWCKRYSHSYPTPMNYEHGVELTHNGDDPAGRDICKIHRLANNSERDYTHIWKVRNTQLPLADDQLCKTNNKNQRGVSTNQSSREYLYDFPHPDDRCLTFSDPVDMPFCYRHPPRTSIPTQIPAPPDLNKCLYEKTEETGCRVHQQHSESSVNSR